MDAQSFPQVGVVMVPFPGYGHATPLLHLSYLIASYDLPVHFVVSATRNHQAKLRLKTSSSNIIHFHDLSLPPSKPNSSGQSSTPQQPRVIVTHDGFNAAMHLRQPVFQLVQQLASKYQKIIVIHDGLMGSVAQDVRSSSITNAELYVFHVVPAFCIFVGIWKSLSPDERKTLIPCQQLLNRVVPRSLPSEEGCVSPEAKKFLANQPKLFNFTSQCLLNTSRVIEDAYIELIEKHSKVTHFAIGPLNNLEEVIKTGSEINNQRHKCLEWLDKQEKDSVIYVSFGSSVAMSNEQIIELADGLERSSQKFIWVLASKLHLEGYEERVKDRGMVVREWAPQLEILAHPSTGGFVSHCGWNSCMESISMGVPMATWPMHSDQPWNAVLVTEVLKLGIMLRAWEAQVDKVTSSVIESVIRRLMASEEGEEIRKRAAEVGEAVRGSATQSGASCFEMDSFIAHITRKA